MTTRFIVDGSREARFGSGRKEKLRIFILFFVGHQKRNIIIRRRQGTPQHSAQCDDWHEFFFIIIMRARPISRFGVCVSNSVKI